MDILTFDRLLQTETVGTTTVGTAVALGKRKKFCISVDRAANVAFGYSGSIVAGPTYDSYSETNADTNANLSSADLLGVGQSFEGEAGVGNLLVTTKFYMKKTGLPTGNATSKIYATTGTDGVSAIPSGAALATSGTFNVATLTGSLALVTFTFTGGNQIELHRNVVYFVSVEYSGGDGLNNVQVGYDGSAPTHSGNYASLTGSTWTPLSTRDTSFYVSITARDLALPGAGIYTLQNNRSYTHLSIYNPSGASSVITSVFEPAT